MATKAVFAILMAFCWLNSVKNQLIITSSYENVKFNARCNSSEYIILTLSQTSIIGCARGCLIAPACVSFNAAADDRADCDLLAIGYYDCYTSDEIVQSTTHNYYDLNYCQAKPCVNGGVCNSNHINGVSSVYCTNCPTQPQRGPFCE